MSLCILPAELLKAIISEVAISGTNESRVHLKNLRLVNKALAALTMGFLFEEVPLWLGLVSRANLGKISNHPEMYVKRASSAINHFT